PLAQEPAEPEAGGGRLAHRPDDLVDAFGREFDDFRAGRRGRRRRRRGRQRRGDGGRDGDGGRGGGGGGGRDGGGGGQRRGGGAIVPVRNGSITSSSRWATVLTPLRPTTDAAPFREWVSRRIAPTISAETPDSSSRSCSDSRRRRVSASSAKRSRNRPRGGA